MNSKIHSHVNPHPVSCHTVQEAQVKVHVQPAKFMDEEYFLSLARRVARANEQLAADAKLVADKPEVEPGLKRSIADAAHLFAVSSSQLVDSMKVSSVVCHNIIGLCKVNCMHRTPYSSMPICQLAGTGQKGN